MTDKPRIGIIISTTRATRFADKPTEWFLDIASKRSDVEFEIVDLRDYPMPFFEEPASPAFAPVQNEAARRWQEKIASLDGYVFVVAEYNHSISGVLKNALDFAYREFNRKPATFIGYGGAGAARAIEHLRGILGELQVADLKYVVSIGMLEYIGIAREGKSFADFPYLADSTKPMLDDLVWWANALREAREELREAA
jgi:NAD(P)H-dependent FMN reductase